MLEVLSPLISLPQVLWRPGRHGRLLSDPSAAGTGSTTAIIPTAWALPPSLPGSHLVNSKKNIVNFQLSENDFPKLFCKYLICFKKSDL